MRRLNRIVALFLWRSAGADDGATPWKIEKETFVYAVRDTDTLRLDRYAALTPDSRTKPCLMFLFGGGFMTGTRDNRRFRPFFDYYARKGFRRRVDRLPAGDEAGQTGRPARRGAFHPGAGHDAFDGDGGPLRRHGLYLPGRCRTSILRGS